MDYGISVNTRIEGAAARELTEAVEAHLDQIGAVWEVLSAGAGSAEYLVKKKEDRDSALGFMNENWADCAVPFTSGD